MRRTLALLLLLTPLLSLSAAEMRYVFKRGEGSYIVTGGMDVGDIGPATKRWSGDFLWAWIEGKEYLIRDAATLDEARRAFAEVEANQEQYHALTAKMRPVEKRQHALERRHDDLSDALSDEPEDYTEAQRREMEQRISEIEAEMRPIEQELAGLERQEEVLDDRQERLEKIAETRLRQVIERAVARGVAEPV